MNQKNYQQELEDELIKLVSFKSVTSDTDATKKLLLYIEEELLNLGLLVVLKEHNEFWSLIAGTRSLDKSKVLLQAHIDVVPAPEKLFKINKSNGRLKARGVYDMLFALASYMVILRSLARQGVLHDYDLGLMLTSDEEVGGHNGVGSLIKNYTCEVCILPDAGRKDILNTGSKGVLQLRVLVEGVSGHSARPNEYVNPISKAAYIVRKLEELYDNQDVNKTTCSITVIDGGAAFNQVPDSTSLVLDIRYTSDDDPKKIQQKVDNIARKANATTEVIALEAAFSININNSYINKFINTHTSVTGRKVTFDSSNGSSDARFIVPKGIPVIMTRPNGGGLHAPTEWVSLRGLQEFTLVLEQYLQEII